MGSLLKQEINWIIYNNPPGESVLSDGELLKNRLDELSGDNNINILVYCESNEFFLISDFLI